MRGTSNVLDLQFDPNLKPKLPIDPYSLLSRLREKIPEILASVNRFVSEVAGGDLIGCSKRFGRPMDFVNVSAPSIVRMGKDKNSARKKAWMYMRWMVRDYPDLRIFDHFSPRDLFVPLDKNVA
ncbi:hypothetical protein DRP04_08345 [Archaeoglobales archaeon]|nr:MAG: hypothetical protein DRP04_08345 [Archaeoglobales archaeon]